MKEYFQEVPQIKYEGAQSKNPFAFKFYDKDKIVLGKTMQEHLPHDTRHTFTSMWKEKKLDDRFRSLDGVLKAGCWIFDSHGCLARWLVGRPSWTPLPQPLKLHSS